MLPNTPRADPALTLTQDLQASHEALKDALFLLNEQPPEARAAWLQRLALTEPALARALAELLPGLDASLPGLQAPHALWEDLQRSQWPTQLGPWRVLRELARGGMGVVLLAERADGAFDKQVAIKVLPALATGGAAASAFAAEVQLLARLEHPHIARLLDAGLHQGQPYLVMELVQGVPITEHVARVGGEPAQTGTQTQTRARVLGPFLQLCEAVGFAHAQLLVHRDIKPANVLVDERGQVRLLDFGIAKVLPAEGPDAPQTLHGPGFTPAYASPEQILGEPVAVGSDVFSLGVLLYRLLTGRHPFLGERQGTDNTLAVARAVLENEPERGPLLAAQVPADLQAILFKALEKTPARRYGSVDALRADLVAFQQGHPVSAQPPRWAYQTRRFVQRHRGAVGLASGATLLVLGFGVWALHSAQLAREQAGLAERRLAAVRALAHKVVHDYNGALEPVPGTLALRKTLVADALAYLDATRREAQDDPALMADVARGYEAVGDVQGRGATGGNLGELVAARASYGQAVALRRRLCEAEGGLPKVAAPALAPATAPAVAASANAANATTPAAPCTAYALALDRLGDNLFSNGLVPGALAVFDSGLQANAPLLASLPAGSAQHDQALVTQHRLMQKLAGLSARQSGEAWLRGTAMAREQLALSTQLAHRLPGRESQERLRHAHDFLAFRLQAEGDVAAAWPHAEQALALSRQLGGEQPNRHDGVTLALALVRSGELQALAARPVQARALLQQALAQARALHLAEPEDAHLRGRYANVARRVAAAFNALGQAPDLAANQALLAPALAASAVFKPEDGPFFFQHQQLLLESARLALLQGRPQAAQPFLAQWPASLPPNPRAALDAADAFLLRARVAVATGKADAARAAFETALGPLKAAWATTPANAENAQRLAEAWQWALKQSPWQVEHSTLRAELDRLLQQMRERRQLTPLGAQRLGVAA